MKSKKFTIFIIVIVFITIIPTYLTLNFINSDSSSPKSYSSIKDFETETDISVYQFYDLEEYIINNNEILLNQSTNHSSIGLTSKNKEEKSYWIETQKTINDIFMK